MHIHILQVTRARGVRSNKDTNGGYGTVNDFGQGLVARGLKFLKNRIQPQTTNASGGPPCTGFLPQLLPLS